MVVERRSTPHPGKPFQVVWTRGRGCRELAEVLGGDTAIRSWVILTDACVEARPTWWSVGSCPIVRPGAGCSADGPSHWGFGSVVAAVAGGPHSALAAEVAAVIGRSASVPASMVCAYEDEGEPNAWPGSTAYSALFPISLENSPSRIRRPHGPGTGRRPPGARRPGGTWFHRLFFGAGARLRQAAPNGAVVVRSAPLRVFHVMVEPVYVAPLIGCAEALQVTSQRVAGGGGRSVDRDGDPIGPGGGARGVFRSRCAATGDLGGGRRPGDRRR